MAISYRHFQQKFTTFGFEYSLISYRNRDSIKTEMRFMDENIFAEGLIYKHISYSSGKQN